MGQIALIIRMNSVSAADLATLRQQFQQFLQTTLPAALLAANANTQVTIAVDKNSTYAENF
jgi:hypothetical protein